MCLSHVLPTQLKQLLWLEEEIHGLDVLKCFTVISGELFVMMDSLMQQQELSATLWDSDMLEERWTSTSMVWVMGGFGMTMSPAAVQKKTLVSVHAATGEFATVTAHTVKTSPFLAT